LVLAVRLRLLRLVHQVEVMLAAVLLLVRYLLAAAVVAATARNHHHPQQMVATLRLTAAAAEGLGVFLAPEVQLPVAREGHMGMQVRRPGPVPPHLIHLVGLVAEREVSPGLKHPTASSPVPKAYLGMGAVAGAAPLVGAASVGATAA
jgi:hypothetical protein